MFCGVIFMRKKLFMIQFFKSFLNEMEKWTIYGTYFSSIKLWKNTFSIPAFISHKFEVSIHENAKILSSSGKLVIYLLYPTLTMLKSIYKLKTWKSFLQWKSWLYWSHWWSIERRSWNQYEFVVFRKRHQSFGRM